MTTDNPQIPDDIPKDGALLAEPMKRGGDRRRKKPSGLVITLLLAIALFSALLAIHWAVSGFLHSRKIVIVPDLTGKTLEQALDILSPLKLALAKESVQVDENSPPGAILLHSPPKGLHVREGKIVRVTLSSGGQVVFAPELTAVTLTEAQNRLRAAGLALGAVTQVYSLQNDAGQVMEQTPAASTVVRPNAMVDLKVSKGPPPEGMALMPDFINRPYASAKQWADEQKISPEMKEELTAVFLPGVVIRQFPSADSAVTEKTPVAFVVSLSSSTESKVGATVRYQLPPGSDSAKVRVVIRDDGGEQEVYSAVQSPGSVVEVPVSPQGPARARIFVNGVLVEERPIK
ncbi:MAG: PASTA domain-containing protein [Elusimicrobia bacterium]|nr:PASTA domain-containing protein [Elusimicrobiota bacterium]